MDKITYLAELAEGLARWVPERERQDILRYYAEYFEEAGPAREAEVVQELGDPWALSCRLAVEGGYVTQEQASHWQPPKKKKWPWVLAGCAVLAVALVGSLFSALITFSQSIWRNNTAAYSEAVVSVAVVDDEEFVDYGRSVEGVTVVEGTDCVDGFWNAEDGTLEQFESIDADISLGNITIHSGEGSDFTLFISQGTNLRGYSVDWEVKDGVLKLRDGKAFKQAGINNWKDLKSMFSGIADTLDVTITVPYGFELAAISVKTDLGNVFLSDLYTAAKVEAETSMGNVECYEVRTANKLGLKTSMGNVILELGELSGGVDIDLETSMGNVEANLDCTQEECEFELETDMGEVTVNGVTLGSSSRAEQKGNYPYKLDAESSMGNVDVYFRDDRW